MGLRLKCEETADRLSDTMKNNKFNFVQKIFLFIFGLILICVFFAQSFGLAYIVSPELALSIAGFSTNYLTIILFFILIWVAAIIFVPLILPKFLGLFVKDYSEKEKENVLDNFFQSVIKNAIIIFLTILLSGLINPFNSPLGNDFNFFRMNWFLFWFILIQWLWRFPYPLIWFFRLTGSKKVRK